MCLGYAGYFVEMSNNLVAISMGSVCYYLALPGQNLASPIGYQPVHWKTSLGLFNLHGRDEDASLCPASFLCPVFPLATKKKVPSTQESTFSTACRRFLVRTYE
jgi:hypothetical protein